MVLGPSLRLGNANANRTSFIIALRQQGVRDLDSLLPYLLGQVLHGNRIVVRIPGHARILLRLCANTRTAWQSRLLGLVRIGV